jgi:hypothetical protein
MTTLREKIKTALDESRMLILGAQIFLGFHFRAVFEPGFERLSKSAQYLKMVALMFLLTGIALMMSPGSYHRIVRSGSDAEDVHTFATTVMDFGLIPFLLAFSFDLYLATATVLSANGAIGIGVLTGFTAISFWYAFGLLSKPTRRASKNKPREMPRPHPTKLEDKVDQVLTEARVVLPGAQALLGFQLVTMFMDGFDKIPQSSKDIHIVSLSLIALTMILLMTPAAYHRIALDGEDTAHFHKVASTLLLTAMIFLPLGICGDVYVVFRKVTESTAMSIIAAATVLMIFYGLWFGFTSYRRAKLAQG